jgi:hypothetical protein
MDFSMFEVWQNLIWLNDNQEVVHLALKQHDVEFVEVH